MMPTTRLATTPHAFVPPTRGPGWLCAQCGKGQDDPAHTVSD